MNMTALQSEFQSLIATTSEWINSPTFYTQCGLILLAIIFAYSFAGLLKKRSPLFQQMPETGPWLPLKRGVFQVGYFLFPLLTILILGACVELSELAVQQSWLIRVAQSLAVVFMLYSVIVRFVTNPFIFMVAKWILIPIAVLHVFGWLDNVTAYLDSINIRLGNIRLSAYGLARLLIFGSILFWLGRISNKAGKQIIRKQENIDIGIREVFAKLFEIVLFFVIFILLLQIMGINLTALAVFGGALGIGLGFGLQAIASNFISGLIILLDRSITVGDYIELEDGAKGLVREINMRSTVLETFDGKDIVVPNEKFVTARFLNWTHKNKKQRYSFGFQVAYNTDIPVMIDLVRGVVRSHPQVIDGSDMPEEELADVEISGFGESGIDIEVEFWMEGVDDGENNVCADLRLMIWQAFRDNHIEMPFPQREVRILNATLPSTSGS